ncbi:MAG: hypothetical protein J6F31_04520 [Oscillospiraceae bacterium]|nr:hypothetical protein [Oscillospiraceae bacterium]
MSFISEEYSEVLPLYKAVEAEAFGLISSSLDRKNLSIHQITSRVKDENSTIEKLRRKNAKYSSFRDFTDMVGIRVICYFSSDVDAVGEAVSGVFEVNRLLSIDKREVIAPNAFGYISLHFICSLKKREGLSDELCSIPFEVQIRSILQHAWAEIEHDLGYKTEIAVPAHVRREFSRIAGLLEVADECFDRIRAGLKGYEANVHAVINDKSVHNYGIDLVTLKAFVNYSNAYIGLCTIIAQNSGAAIRETSPETYVQLFHAFGIDSVGMLYGIMEENYGAILEMAAALLKGAEIDELASTVGLYYILRVWVKNSGFSENEIRQMLESDGMDRETAERIVRRMVRKHVDPEKE